jgi:hypothetical protein
MKLSRIRIQTSPSQWLITIKSRNWPLDFSWIEYAYLLGMKISCCHVRASRALLIGHAYILSGVVVHCLSIAQRAPVLEREPRFVPQVRPCDRTVFKSGLRWSTTWWKGAAFYHRRPVDRLVLAGGIDRFLIVMPDHAESSGFIIRNSLRANPDDRVVVDGVPFGGHTGPSIGFVIYGCLMAAWNVVVKFLRP